MTLIQPVFSDDLLQAKITLEELNTNNTELDITSQTSNANLQSAESIIIPIYSLNRALLSNTSVKANRFLNEDLISLSEPSLMFLLQPQILLIHCMLMAI